MANTQYIDPALFSIAQKLADQRFTPSSTQRSPAYKSGFMAAILYRLGCGKQAYTHKEGSAEFDAYFSGYKDSRINVPSAIALIQSEVTK